MSKFIHLNIDFEKEIAPLLEEAKKATNNYSRHIVGFLASGALGVLILFLLGLYEDWEGKKIAQYSVIFLLILGVAVIFSKEKDDENILKAYSLDEILEKLNYTWGVSIINDELIQESKLFPKYDYMESDDEFLGYEEGFSITIAELTLVSRVSANAGNRHIDFNGLVLLYIFEEVQIETKILLKPKKFLNLFTTPKGFEKIETKLNIIDKDFEFYTNDKEEAQKVLTPKFLEKFTKVQEYFSFSNVSCCMSGNYCLVALHTKQDFFKLKSFELEGFKKEFNVLLKELQNISDFGKELKEALK